MIGLVVGRKKMQLEASRRDLPSSVIRLSHERGVPDHRRRVSQRGLCDQERYRRERSPARQTSSLKRIVSVWLSGKKKRGAVPWRLHSISESKLDMGEVVVTGKRCEEAKKAIEENASRVTSFFVEKDYRHLLIEREGKAVLLCRMRTMSGSLS